MAVTKIHPIKSTLKKALDYIENPEKTEDKMLVSSFGCSYETADIEFEMLLAQAMQKGNNLAHHLIQSFAPGEATPEQAHEIGKRLADEVLQGKYPYVLTTHIDKGHVHNHIIFCAVDMVNCRKYVSNKQSWYINRASVFIMFVFGIAGFVQFSSSVAINQMIKIADNMDEYTQYVQFNTTDKIADGIYRICPYENDKLSIACLDLENKKNSEIALMSNQQNQLEIKTIDDRVYLRFYNSELYLDLRNNKEIENGPIQAHQKNNTDAQKWVLKRDCTQKDIYYILIGTQSALSYDSEGKICIKKFDGSNTQKWRLI